MRRFVKPTRWVQFVTLTLAAVISGWGSASGCLAQVAPGMFRGRVETGVAELLPAPRSVRQQIREAQEALQQERYSDAVVRLGDLLRRTSRENLPETAQDYFLSPSRQPGLPQASENLMQRKLGGEDDTAEDPTAPRTVLGQVREMIGQLPKPAIEIYELRYGPLASKILQDAQASRDWDAVEQVRREFFHTQAGYRATYLLATREWLLGNPLAVSLLLDDVVELPRAIDQLGEEVIWWHAGACLLAKRPLPTPTGNLTAESEDWERAVGERYPGATFKLDPPAAGYPYLGARPNRSGYSEGQMPLSGERWMVETSGSPRQQRMLETKTAELKSNRQMPPPSWMPLRVGDQLLMRTTERLLGVDYRTGKRVWNYPWFSTPEAIETPDDDDSGRRGEEEEDPNEILIQRVFNDVPYGQISADAQRVYLLNDLGRVESERFNPFGMRAMRSVKASKNTLVALDLATEGKLLWRIGSLETTPSRFSDAFFLGPPLPFRGRLYVMVEIAGEIVLACLDPSDGSEIWRQVLVSVESSGITTDPVRRVAGAMPSYHQGLLICPTGAGLTIAVNLIDRTLRWVNIHPRNQNFSRNAFRQPERVSMSQLSQRWMTSVAIGHGPNVALTPVESDRMIVADAVTGADRFRPKPRGKNLYLAGIRDSKYLIVRADKVMAHDLNTGEEIWSTPGDMMNTGQRVSGRGVFGKTSYFLPTTSDELIEIDLANGHVVARRSVQFPLGNLVAADGQMISQGTTSLAVAFGEKSLRPQVESMLATDPDDFLAMVLKAELLMQDDKREEALALLDRARAIEPDSDEVIALSVTAMLGGLREGEAIAPEDLQTLRELIDRPEQQAELLVLQIQRKLKSSSSEQPSAEGSQEDLLAAFDLLCELSTLMTERPSVANQQAAVFPDPSRQFTLSAWIAARVAEIVVAADESTRRRIETRLNEHLTGDNRTNRNTLSQVVEHFSPLLETSDQPLQNLIEHYQGQNDPLAMERLVWGTEMPTDAATENLDTPSLLKLAQLYSQAHWNRDRRNIGDILQQRIQLPDAPAEQIREITQTMDEFQVQGAGRVDPQRWPRKVDLQWKSARLPQTRTADRRYARTTRLMGRQTEGWQAVSGNYPLALLDHNGVSNAVNIEGLTNRNSSDKEITICGGVMLVLTPSELIAVDLFRVMAGRGDDIVRWRHSFHPEGEPIARRRSSTSKFGDQIYRYVANSSTANADDAQLRLGPVLGDRLFLLQGEDLICYHLITGQQLWRTKTEIAGSGVVVGQGRVGVLSERHEKIAFFDWYDGEIIESQAMQIDSLIATLGPHALLISKYDEAEGEVDLFDPYMLEIVDCISMKRVRGRVASPVNLTSQSRSASYGELINGRSMVLLDDRGRATIWDVLSGESLADVSIPVRPGLYGLSVVEVKDRFLLMPRCKQPKTKDSSTSNVTVASGLSVQGASSVHCIETHQKVTNDVKEIDSRDNVDATEEADSTEETEAKADTEAKDDTKGKDDTGASKDIEGANDTETSDDVEASGEEKPEQREESPAPAARVAWSVEFDQARGITTYQPWLTPMVLFVRGHAFFESTASPRRELDVWGLDIADGKVLNEVLGKNIINRNNQIETHVRLFPQRDQLIATIQSELLTYTFSDPATEDDTQ